VTDIFPFLLAGLTSGALFGLAGTGLVLTYKTSGIFNFAHGAVAAAAAYAFYEGWQVRGWPWPVAAAVSLVLVGPVVGSILELVARRVGSAEPATRIVATVALLLVIQGAATAIYGPTPIAADRFLPDSTFAVGDIAIGWDQLITVAIATVAVIGLFLFFRKAPLGVEMRAVVDAPELLDLTGSSPARVRRSAWIIGCTFAGVSGILVAPSLGLEASLLTLLVIQAFGAAAVGRFQNLGVTFAAGLGIGVAAAILTKYIADLPELSGLPSSLPFLVLFVALLFLPAEAVRSGTVRRRPYRPIRFGRRTSVVLVTPTLLLVGFVPSLVGAKLPVYTNAAIYVTLFASLALLVRTSGQVSLCHATFAAAGATTFSHLTVGAGLPWLVALLLTGLAVVPIGALVALPAIRLSGLYLALSTFGFGILVERVVFPKAVMFGVTGQRLAARPHVLGLDGDRGFFYLCVGIAAVSLLVVSVIGRSRLGRLLRGLADSPVVLATHGTNANTTRVLAFCASAFLASISGALILCLTGTANTAGFGAFQSLTLLAVLAIAGRSTLAAPVLAALLFVVAPSYVSDPNLNAYLQMAFGGAALVATCFGPGFGDWVAGQAITTRSRRAGSPVSDRAHRRTLPAGEPA
jgi:branched-subunit amino acid ABC-type transport system permease component